MLRRENVPLFCVLAVATTVMFVNLGSARLWDRDEPRNAGCALEMMERGDWIVPVFNDELRHQKPVLLYWLIGSAYWVFGVNEFAARFWSGVFAIGTVALTYVIGKRLFSSTAATMGALALATSLMFVVAGRAATPDSILIFCQTLALTLYVCGTFSPKQHDSERPKLRKEGNYFPCSIPVCISIYAAMGLAVLAKGPVGFIMPMAIIGMFMLLETLPVRKPQSLEGFGNLTKSILKIAQVFGPKHFLKTLLQMNPLLAAAVVVAVAGPWFVLVGMQTDGEFIRRFFLEENIGRATTTFESHGGGIWYYPTAIAVGFFPWSIFLVPMFLGIDRRLSKSHPLSTSLTFLLCWIGVQVGMFSFASTKLPSYVTPCFPALALCCGLTLERWTRQTSRLPIIWDKAVLATLGLTGVGLSVALAYLCKNYLGGDYWLVGLGVIWIVVAFVGCFHLSPARWPRWIVMFQGTAALFCIGLFGFGTIAVDRTQQAERLIEPIRARGTPVAAFRCLESSWVFYSRKSICELETKTSNSNPSVPLDGLRPKKSHMSPSAFVAQHPDACIITTDEALVELKAQLPGHYQVVETAPYFMRDKYLFLLAPSPITRIAQDIPTNRTDK